MPQPTTPTSLVRRQYLTTNKNNEHSKPSKAKKKRMNSEVSTADENSLLNGNRRGAKLFTDLDCHILNGNPRAQSDPYHAAYIEKLHKGSNIDSKELLTRYKMLSAQDINDDESWRFATVIVPTNRERIDIIGDTVIEFAKSTGQPVIRWACFVQQWDGAPIDLQLQEDAMNDPCFWQYFVIGATAICNENLSVDINITNGAPLELYSLTFNTQQEQINYENMRLAAKPGDFVTLQQPPLSVNVIPWPESNNKQPDTYAPYSIEKKLDTNQAVVPITAQAYTKTPKPIPVRGGEGWFTSKAIIIPLIPFDLAFSMTSFKAQGRTLHRVILSLTHRYGSGHNFSFHEFLVAISRVELGEHIRIMPPIDNQTNKFDYLETLRPNQEIMQMLKGLQSGKWDPETAWQARELTEN
jgi:hypothetical protein